MTCRIVVIGAAGRMGRAIMREVLDADDLALAGGVVAPEDAGQDLGALAGGSPLGRSAVAALADVTDEADVLIDFSSAAGAVVHCEAAAAGAAPIVVGATGFTPADEARIAAAAARAAILKSGNMSLGVNLLTALVRRAAEALGDEFDIEIIEAHHRAKADAPSGTALMLAAAAAEGRGVSLDEKAVFARQGQTGARRSGDIGFAVVRGGGVVGDHDVLFAGRDEALTLSHRAFDRRLFARGAVAAARWLARHAGGGGAPGLYDMTDVLGLNRSRG